VFLQGQMDSDLQLMARCHVALNQQNVTKLMTQVYSWGEFSNADGKK
jgi:mitochondrial import receptor subunit TOM40